MMGNILIVMGTRPDVLKLIPVYHGLSVHGIDPVVCTSGQHRELLEDALRDFGIPVHYNLKALDHASTLAELTSYCILQFDRLLSHLKPSAVVVQGDTATAYSAAISAFYKQIPIVHVEAGLRSNDIHAPFPEEFFRRSISHIASLHCAPTALSAYNIMRENNEADVVVTGNTIIDSLEACLQTISTNEKNLNNYNVLVTMHRRESFDGGMRTTFETLKEISAQHPHVRFTLPMHPNPEVKKALEESGLMHHPSIELTQPLSYKPFIETMVSADLIMSDSGGVQEEAAYLGKKLLIMRDKTERPECLWSGSAELVGTKKEVILSAFNNAIKSKKQLHQSYVFGYGMSGKKIAEQIIKRYVLKQQQI